MLRKLLFLVFLSTPLAAQDLQLFIERIEVRNHDRVSPDVVIAESRLRAGQSYTEGELRDAAARLSRLPFLLSVDFSLEKGSERGNYVLVLAINETRPFFFHLDLVPVREQNGTNLSVDTADRPGTSSEVLALGGRWFVGRRGAVHIGFSAGREEREFTNEYAAFVAGYTQYDLFGTRAFATINLKRPLVGQDDGLLSPQFVLGVPITANQTLTLEYDELHEEDAPETFGGQEVRERYDQRVLSARLSYNTTNEPFFPTEGTLLTLTPHFGWTDSTDALYTYPENEPVVLVTHARTWGLQAGATRFHELRERDSVWLDLRGRWEIIDRSSEPEYFVNDGSAVNASVGIGYAHSLWSRAERANGDSRFEFTGRYLHRAQEERRFFDNEDSNVQLSFAWIRRTSWGTFRLGAGAAW